MFPKNTPHRFPAKSPLQCGYLWVKTLYKNLLGINLNQTVYKLKKQTKISSNFYFPNYFQMILNNKTQDDPLHLDDPC